MQTKIKDKTVFLVEAKQAAFLKFATFLRKQMGAILGAWAARKSSTPTCAATWRSDTARWFSAGAFGRNQLQGMYEQQQAQAAAAQPEGRSAPVS